MIRVPFTLFFLLALISESVQAQNFTLRTLSPGVQSARDIVARDFDGDGDVDLAIGSWSPGGVVYFEHQLFDSIDATEILAVGGTGRQVTSGDFDGDGDEDIAYASFSEDRYYVLVNTGNPDPASRFEVTTLVEGAGGAFAVRAADVNNDNAMDLVCADFSSQRVRVYEQIAGQLVETWINVVPQPLDVDVADINGDGVKEILIAAAVDGGIYRMSRNQNGSYSLTQEIPGHYLSCVRVTDLDNDGAVDILAAEFAEQRIMRWERSGNSWVQSMLPGNPWRGWEIVVADFDEDDLLDVAASALGYQFEGGGVFWWRQTASGAFTQQTLSSEPDYYGLEGVDYDHDGDTDLIAANNGGSEVIWFRNNMGVPSWILGDITSERDGLPIGGVRVLAEESGAYTLSDASGHYSLGLSNGTYALRFEHPCWETAIVESVTVAFEDTANANAQMRRAQMEIGVTSLNVFVPWGGASTHLIPLSNSGDAELHVSGVAESTSPDNAWISLESSEFTVAPGQSAAIEIIITADTLSGLLPEYLGEIILETNSCPDTLLSIAVVAVVLDAPDRPEPIPSATTLLSAYPNPFNASLTVPLVLSTRGSVELSIHDVTGRFVESLHEGDLPAGRYEFVWDAARLSSGRYVISLRSASGVHSARTVTLIK